MNSLLKIPSASWACEPKSLYHRLYHSHVLWYIRHNSNFTVPMGQLSENNERNYSTGSDWAKWQQFGKRDLPPIVRLRALTPINFFLFKCRSGLLLGYSTKVHQVPAYLTQGPMSLPNFTYIAFWSNVPPICDAALLMPSKSFYKGPTNKHQHNK